MARIAILLPRDEMLEPAKAMAALYNLDVFEIASIHTSAVMQKAKELEDLGVDIVIARGRQAMLIKQSTKLPVVEIQLTGQEMGMLVNEAMNLVNVKKPSVAVVGFGNMFCDISNFSNIFPISLETYYTDFADGIADAATRAIQAGADVLIGGDIVCEQAAKAHVPSVFISSSGESIGEACRIASHMAYAIDQEKRNTAELRAILDYTINGIAQLDAQGTIQHMNYAAERIFDITEKQATGTYLNEWAPSVTVEMITSVLNDGKELISIPFKIESTTFLASLTPILMDNKVSGAIFCIYEGRQLEQYAAEQRHALMLQGHKASFTFETMPLKSSSMIKIMEQAAHYANFNMPMLILGEFGTEKEELAQCVHNASIYSDNAFVSFNCGGYSQEESELLLFGQKAIGQAPPVPGLVDKAQGILFLNEISQLSLNAQYKVYRLIARQFNSSFGGVEPRASSLRIIAADSRDLAGLVKTGEFREDLYYSLSVMTLYVPPLRQRKDDIITWAEYFFDEFQHQHGRFIRLNKDAQARLAAYSWDGNLAQLRNLCERLFVNSPRRLVDQVFIEKQMQEAYPVVHRNTEGIAVVYKDPKSARISELLQKHSGSRTAVANEMGISTTTLWRYMKKYGIET